MSNRKDKTRQQLVESMRKTRAGSGQTGTQTAKKVPGSSSSSRTTRAGAEQRAKPAMAGTIRQSSAADPYQSRGRIWPD